MMVGHKMVALCGGLKFVWMVFASLFLTKKIPKIDCVVTYFNGLGYSSTMMYDYIIIIYCGIAQFILL